MGVPLPIALNPGFNVSRVSRQSLATFVNMYAEPGSGKGTFTGIGYPGQIEIGQFDPIRGIYADPRFGGAFHVVAGTSWLTVTADGASTTIGTVPGADLVEWAANAYQIACIANGRMFVLDVPNNVFQENTDPDFLGASSIDCVNRTGIWSVPGSDRFQISAIDDFLSVAALDTARAESSVDPIVAVRAVNNEPWLFGTRGVEPWPNTGAANFPFERRTVNQNVGCIARDTVRVFNNTVAWLGYDAASDTLGVFIGAGYDAQPISGFPVARLLERTAYPERARAIVWGVEGHEFYTLTTDAGSVTYDATTGIWHQTASGTWPMGDVPPPSKWTARAKLGTWQVFGDEDGRLTRMSWDARDDAGTYLTQEFVTPMTGSVGQRMRAYTLEAELDAGVGTATEDPEVQMQTLKDGGKRVSDARTARLGLRGAYATRPRWSRLGAARDLAFRIRLTNARMGVVQLWARAEVSPRS